LGFCSQYKVKSIFHIQNILVSYEIHCQFSGLYLKAKKNGFNYLFYEYDEAKLILNIRSSLVNYHYRLIHRACQTVLRSRIRIILVEPESEQDAVPASKAPVTSLMLKLDCNSLTFVLFDLINDNSFISNVENHEKKPLKVY
jgi:hypothetical protein